MPTHLRMVDSTGVHTSRGGFGKNLIYAKRAEAKKTNSKMELLFGLEMNVQSGTNLYHQEEVVSIYA